MNQRTPKPIHTLVELHDRACRALVSAGFEKRVVSSKTEAMYFGWPGRSELIRIAWHQGNGPPLGLNRVAAKITFGEDGKRRRPGTMRISDGAFERLIAVRIGEYLLRTGTGDWLKQPATVE